MKDKKTLFRICCLMPALIYLAILNCVAFDEYEFHYSVNNAVRSAQYLCNGAWTAFTIFFPIACGFMSLITIGSVIDSIVNPK